MPSSGPVTLSHQRSIPPAYGQHAVVYDAHTQAFQGFRNRIVQSLPLRPADRVLDVGCGTGLCFAALQERLGPTGEVIGVDASPDMTALAAERAEQNGWSNVTLVAAPAEEAMVPGPADAALFCATHDILQSAPALSNVLSQLRPGAWVAAGGGKFAKSWFVGLNLQVRALHEPYVRSFDGFSRPWSVLEGFLDGFTVEEFALGTGYCASGRVRG